MSRAVMQQALDYIVTTNSSSRFLLVPESNLNKTIAALRAALAGPQTTHWEGCEAVHPECRKPALVAWVEPKWLDPDTRGWPSDSFASQPIEGWLPLYTAPNPRKPLTEEEIDGLRLTTGYAAGLERFTFIARAVIAAYEAKNGLAGEGAA